MTVIFNVAQTVIPANFVFEHTENIPQNAKRIGVTYTRPVTWPEGIIWPVRDTSPQKFKRNIVGVISITYPGGAEGPWKPLAGGDIFFSANGKQQAPMVVPAGFRFDDALYEATGEMTTFPDPSQTANINIRMTEDYFIFSWRNPATGLLDLPKGQYKFKIETFNTVGGVGITTAIIGERFNP